MDTPATVLHVYWIIATAAVVLIAGLVADRSHRVRGRLPIVAAGTVLVLHGVILAFGLWPWTQLSPYAAAPLAVWGVLAQKPGVRRRVIAWAVPVVAAAALVKFGYADFIRHNGLHPEALRMIGPGTLAILIGVPVAAFALAASANRSIEAAQGHP